MGPGSTLVVHTTASPKTIEAVAARTDAVDVVDAPVSGGPHDIAAGKLTLFVGGADDTVARLQPILGCYGDPVLHVGPIGAGQTVKLVNNALFAGHIGLLAESIRLGERLGVPESTVLGRWPTAAPPAGCWTLWPHGVRSRGSSRWPGSSSARTSHSFVASPRTSAATSAPWTTSSKLSVPAERSDMTQLGSFSVRHESATVSVTVRHSIVTVPARPNPHR